MTESCAWRNGETILRDCGVKGFSGHQNFPKPRTTHAWEPGFLQSAFPLAFFQTAFYKLGLARTITKLQQKNLITVLQPQTPLSR